MESSHGVVPNPDGAIMFAMSELLWSAKVLIKSFQNGARKPYAQIYLLQIFGQYLPSTSMLARCIECPISFQYAHENKREKGFLYSFHQLDPFSIAAQLSQLVFRNAICFEKLSD